MFFKVVEGSKDGLSSKWHVYECTDYSMIKWEEGTYNELYDKLKGNTSIVIGAGYTSKMPDDTIYQGALFEIGGVFSHEQMMVLMSDVFIMNYKGDTIDRMTLKCAEPK